MSSSRFQRFFRLDVLHLPQQLRATTATVGIAPTHQIARGGQSGKGGLGRLADLKLTRLFRFLLDSAIHVLLQLFFGCPVWIQLAHSLPATQFLSKRVIIRC